MPLSIAIFRLGGGLHLRVIAIALAARAAFSCAHDGCVRSGREDIPPASSRPRRSPCARSHSRGRPVQPRSTREPGWLQEDFEVARLRRPLRRFTRRSSSVGSVRGGTSSGLNRLAIHLSAKFRSICARSARIEDDRREAIVPLLVSLPVQAADATSRHAVRRSVELFVRTLLCFIALLDQRDHMA